MLKKKPIQNDKDEEFVNLDKKYAKKKKVNHYLKRRMASIQGR